MAIPDCDWSFWLTWARKSPIVQLDGYSMVSGLLLSGAGNLRKTVMACSLELSALLALLEAFEALKSSLRSTVVST